MIAKAMDWHPDDITDLKLAALLHHLDQTRIPDSMLAPKVAKFLAEFQRRVYPAREGEFDQTGKLAEAASIIWVADTFDRLVSDQRYRKGLPESEAIEILRYDAEYPVDKAVVEAFIRVHRSKFDQTLPKAA
jgi:HD-GYP domain-containing protein (c-di-GMP phosphodiesterase class II)